MTNKSYDGTLKEAVMFYLKLVKDAWIFHMYFTILTLSLMPVCVFIYGGHSLISLSYCAAWILSFIYICVDEAEKNDK